MKTGFILLVIVTALTGLMAGIGFVNAIGIIPAFKITPPAQILKFWQLLDQKMSVRMPIFGSSILLSMISAGFFLARQHDKTPFCFLLLAFLFSIADIFIAVVYNLPTNRFIQSITVENIPDTFEYFRSRAVFGFNLRSVCMIGTFLSAIAALYLQSLKGLAK